MPKCYQFFLANDLRKRKQELNHINFFSPLSRPQITGCYCYIHCELCYARQLISRAAQRREEQKKAR